RGVMHYFALGWRDAEVFLGLGFYLSFAGLITRPSRGELRDVVRACPADRLLLETDSPYGNAHKRMGGPNRPAYLLDTAELVAELRGMTLEELGDLETRNALALVTRVNGSIPPIPISSSSCCGATASMPGIGWARTSSP